MSSDYTLHVWGARGTIPSPGPNTSRFGGNTSCLTLSLGEHEHLVLDCGSGMRHFGASLPANTAGEPRRFHIFLSHYHFDHIEGFALFLPLYNKHSRITVHGMSTCGTDAKTILESLIKPPYFPVTLADVPAAVDYVETNPGATRRVADITVDTLPLNHPDGCLCFRLDRDGKRIVYATDHEHGDEPTDDALVEFSRGATHLIYDATYQPAEYEEMRKGWGHSTWYAAVQTAVKAGVENLILFHHHPDHTDDELDRVLEAARRDFPNTDVAREGMSLTL